MDTRAEKLANARRKLKDHQQKKTQKDHNDTVSEKNEPTHIQNIPSTEIYPLEFTVEPTSASDEINSIVSESFQTNTIAIESNLHNEKVNEYFIYNQNSLENEVRSVQQKLSACETMYAEEKANHHISKQNISTLEWEIKNLKDNTLILKQDCNKKDEVILELTNCNQTLRNENNNLLEQLELTKSIISSKESDNAHLLNQVNLYLNQLEVTQLQLQQLSSDNTVNVNSNSNKEVLEQLHQEIDMLNKKITSLQQEKDNVVSHYQHYLSDLKEQLNTSKLKNEQLAKEVEMLSDRESSLIEQIGDMEIRFQKFNKKDFEMETQVDTSELQKQILLLQKELEVNSKQYKELLDQYQASVVKIEDLQEKELRDNQETISVAKLTADMTSDKIAAQRATEQNLKLKTDVKDLEEVVIKMTKDKLELTEILTHEKNLSKELMLRLAEIEEKGKIMQNNLKAKDEEMIRLQNEWRELAKKYNDSLQKQTVASVTAESPVESFNHSQHENESSHVEDNNNGLSSPTESLKSMNVNPTNIDTLCEVSNRIPKEDAMCKLQERFMCIMDEVANLSDEKHRLEHIILQLQNETDTICEYVALYQQQRSLLKKRDEDRIHQLKIFEKECNELRDLLGELRELLFRLAEDKEISGYLKTESRLNEMARIRELLEDLQNSSLLNKKFKTMDLSNFYPCSCCSGKLIEV
ncbi:golgin subfamily A member 2-like [Pieris rapae]|uniref:golgin subfamily A member 2-like n=1 Tax=Pieris rapae TaxID=64459 RepID=UPI001E27B462|nr:golgin subfamily A member 2-like [Pieris rapae]